MTIKINRFKKKVNTFKKILEHISELSVSQTSKVACIIIKKDFSKIAAFGYNGTYPNAPINPETGGEELSLEPGKSGFVHAEPNAIAKFREYDPENYIVFISMSPCRSCAMYLVNAGFRYVYYIDEYRDISHLSEIFGRNNIKYGKISELKIDSFE